VAAVPVRSVSILDLVYLCPFASVFSKTPLLGDFLMAPEMYYPCQQQVGKAVGIMAAGIMEVGTQVAV